ncbi:MAG: hypothetical protein ACK4E3_08880 [Brevundimonas sp.]|uniref:hypothetical protein n=1 Tax=Brevundimonas sp. TaxID=1871086 RepID=UPI00391A044F
MGSPNRARRPRVGSLRHGALDLSRPRGFAGIMSAPDDPDRPPASPAAGPTPAQKHSQARAERLARQLRANLRRRKQGATRASGPPQPGPDTE